MKKFKFVQRYITRACVRRRKATNAQVMWYVINYKHKVTILIMSWTSKRIDEIAFCANHGIIIGRHYLGFLTLYFITFKHCFQFWVQILWWEASSSSDSLCIQNLLTDEASQCSNVCQDIKSIQTRIICKWN